MEIKIGVQIGDPQPHEIGQKRPADNRLLIKVLSDPIFRPDKSLRFTPQHHFLSYSSWVTAGTAMSGAFLADTMLEFVAIVRHMPS